MSFVWLAGDYLYGFEPHVSAVTIRRFISHFGTGLFLHSITQIVQLGIMTKEMEASFGCDDLVQPPIGAPARISIDNGRTSLSTGKSFDAGMTAFGTVSKEHDRSFSR